MHGFVLLFAAACAAFGQQPAVGASPHYARAYYTKWKPGKAAEGQTFLKDIPYKGALEWLKGDPAAVGQVTMSRVVPGGSEIGHDRLRLVITSAPPALAGGLAPGSPQFVQAAGMAPAEYSAKLRSLFETVRTEIWTNTYRHGSIRQGDFVAVTWTKVSSDKRSALLDYQQTWESGMRAGVVKRGVTRAQESWQIRFAAEDEPSITHVVVYPSSDAAYRSFGNMQEGFLAEFPGKDYHTFRKAFDAMRESSTGVRSILYRVDLAIWK